MHVINAPDHNGMVGERSLPNCWKDRWRIHLGPAGLRAKFALCTIFGLYELDRTEIEILPSAE
jgi:hypothetical protein